MNSVLFVLLLIYDLENENVLVFFTPKVNFKYLFIFFKSTHFLCSFSNNSFRGQSPWYYKKSLKIFKLLFINCRNFWLFTTKPSLVWRRVTSERNVSRKNAKIFVRISQNFAKKVFATFFFAKIQNAKISRKYENFVKTMSVIAATINYSKELVEFSALIPQYLKFYFVNGF